MARGSKFRKYPAVLLSYSLLELAIHFNFHIFITTFLWGIYLHMEQYLYNTLFIFFYNE